MRDWAQCGAGQISARMELHTRAERISRQTQPCSGLRRIGEGSPRLPSIPSVKASLPSKNRFVLASTLWSQTMSALSIRADRSFRVDAILAHKVCSLLIQLPERVPRTGWQRSTASLGQGKCHTRRTFGTLQLDRSFKAQSAQHLTCDPVRGPWLSPASRFCDSCRPFFPLLPQSLPLESVLALLRTGCAPASRSARYGMIPPTPPASPTCPRVSRKTCDRPSSQCSPSRSTNHC
jgi:hypothetical protein